RRHLRRDDEVALVLAVLVVDEDEHPAVAGFLYDLLDRRGDLDEAHDGGAPVAARRSLARPRRIPCPLTTAFVAPRASMGSAFLAADQARDIARQHVDL